MTNIPAMSGIISSGQYVSITFTCKYTKASGVYSPENPDLNITMYNGSTSTTGTSIYETTGLTTSAMFASTLSGDNSTTSQSQGK